MRVKHVLTLRGNVTGVIYFYERKNLKDFEMCEGHLCKCMG